MKRSAGKASCFDAAIELARSLRNRQPEMRRQRKRFDPSSLRVEPAKAHHEQQTLGEKRHADKP
jgi:hypothetical protein